MKTINYLFTIGLAASAGWVLGILTAPRKGKDTRTQIMVEVDALREQVLNEVDILREQIESNATQKLSKTKKILNRTGQKYKQDTRTAANDLKGVLKD